ncbi:peroxide stress protein YaaA [Microbacterium sp. APC 3901]|uniref:YaaA family protein n=1 Tax=Microbacterium sp. APC 3901 TaxID=3035192 RepID=UPI0025B5B490|nr:peroxide stress protein YaaA [Microbacterium sp. APC 3901]MDN3443410.1 peroxide stress protein YaaA [Microbacterium sp. APC 3901]
MKILLPPSETKRPGGDGAPLDVSGLALPDLGAKRHEVIDALVELAGDEEHARKVLRLSPKQAGDVLHNRMLRSAATMPAVDRYTGVLYDALDAGSLSAASRRWLGAHVWIHSAPLGPIGALDALPPYRLAAGTSLPGLPALRRHWADATTDAMAGEEPDFILDLRSEAYVALGPVPDTVSSCYVRVVTEHGRALNHFNKKSKGTLVRALAQDRPRVRSLRTFRTWAGGRGLVLRRTDDPGVEELVVAE